MRGGGELGEAWRLGGKDANKPNTWRDLIACGKALVAQGYTTPDKLFITGGSAGGITMGRAMEEAPSLFAGVIDQVPAANTLRSEFSPNGPPNIPEFGTVTNEAGFHNLYAMDSRSWKEVAVSGCMITTGLNTHAPWSYVVAGPDVLGNQEAGASARRGAGRSRYSLPCPVGRLVGRYLPASSSGAGCPAKRC